MLEGEKRSVKRGGGKEWKNEGNADWEGIRHIGRMKGRKEGRKERRKEVKQEGRNEVVKEGRKEGRKEGG